MKYLSFILLLSLSAVSFAQSKKTTASKVEVNVTKEVNAFMDQWHQDAANADTVYFSKMAPDGIYIGTDKSELWKRDEFKKWSKPFFDKGKAWDFKATSRNVYFSEDGKYAWFDELLDTWMGVCRSSGVLHRKNATWEIKHYQLSVTLPNDITKDFIKMVNEYEKK
ncbi:MAG: hypothetical protein K0S33_1233 [Bacteroidetes bacterium]|jgi:hypothetical protein|nr:hypothetical protein [Bacteroidota bacterium]